jgi:hypothetical protein
MAWARRERFIPDLTPLDDAIRIGLTSEGTTIVGDTGDGPSGGAAGDNTAVLRALIEGGSDILMIETIFDSLNAKAAAVATLEVFEEDAVKLPVIISAAVGMGGETMISAQKPEALWNAFAHVKPLAIGLNCSLGPDLMKPFLEELSTCAATHISCYPNAGLPNPLAPTGFDLEPPHMKDYMAEFAAAGLLSFHADIGFAASCSAEKVGLKSISMAGAAIFRNSPPRA